MTIIRASSPMTRVCVIDGPCPEDGADVAPPLRVRTLGVFAVWRGEELTPPTVFAQRKAALLFKALLAAPGQRLNREQLLDVLWPEADPAQGAHRLRSTLHRLRGALGADYLPGSGDLVLLDPAPGASSPPAWLDAVAFERAATAALAVEDLAAARSALDLYTGAYLPEEPEAREVAARRRALRALVQALTMHVARLVPPAEAIQLLGGVLREDPVREEAALALMRLLAGQGRAAEALRAYDALAQALGEDLGLDPGPSLQALRAQLLVPAPVAPLTPATIGVDDTPDDPPLLPLSPLPIPLTPFIGRGRELGLLRGMLAGTRLLMLTGPGGCGKTRLALALAQQARSDYPDGLVFVDLAPLTDPALVPHAVATAVGMHGESGQDVLATIVESLRSRRLLLVLDNAEHMVDACAVLATALLESCRPRHEPRGACRWRGNPLPRPFARTPGR